MKVQNCFIFFCKSLVVLITMQVLLSCESDLKRVQKLTETSFVPSGEVDTINLKYTDSGRIKSILKSPKMLELQGNVVITAHDGKKLETSQLYYDQKSEWFFTEKPFKYSDEAGGYLEGPGVDFSKDFKIFNMQRSNGEVNTID